jgi:hypothetical protein
MIKKPKYKTQLFITIYMPYGANTQGYEFDTIKAAKVFRDKNARQLRAEKINYSTSLKRVAA